MQDLSDLTTDEQSLLLDALCCVIASDGRVSGREVAVAVQALGVIGWHPPEPDAKRIIVETCKKIHHQGIEQFTESLIESLRPYRGKLFGQLVIEAQARAIKADSQTTPREKQLAKRFSDAWSGAPAPPPLDSDHSAAIRGSEFVDSKGNSGKGHSTATWLAPSLVACLAAITCAGFLAWAVIYSDRRHIRIQIVRAVALWEEAQWEIDHRHVPEALTLLRRYLDDPHSPEKPAAQCLLAEAEIAASDSETLKALVALTDDEFAQATRTATLTDEKVTRPALKAVRIQTIKRNLPIESKRRHDIRVAEEKRLAEVEQRRLAEIREVEQRRLAEVEQRRLAEVEQRRLAEIREAVQEAFQREKSKDELEKARVAQVQAEKQRQSMDENNRQLRAKMTRSLIGLGPIEMQEITSRVELCNAFMDKMLPAYITWKTGQGSDAALKNGLRQMVAQHPHVIEAIEYCMSRIGFGEMLCTVGNNVKSWNEIWDDCILLMQ